MRKKAAAQYNCAHCKVEMVPARANTNPFAFEDYVHKDTGLHVCTLQGRAIGLPVWYGLPARKSGLSRHLRGLRKWG